MSAQFILFIAILLLLLLEIPEFQIIIIIYFLLNTTEPSDAGAVGYWMEVGVGQK